MLLTVTRWTDPVIDQHDESMDVTSEDAEALWLPFVGPTSFLLARRLVRVLRGGDGPVVMDPELLGRMLGVGGTEWNSPLVRSLRRLHQFSRIRYDHERGTVQVRTRWENLCARQLHCRPELTGLAEARRRQAVA